MPLSISLSSLGSRLSRISSTGGSGIRRFATSGIISRAEHEQEATDFWDGLKRFGGSILAAITWQPSWLNFSFAGLFQAAVGVFQGIVNFNINATDAELDEQIKQQEIAIASAKGAAKGATIGYLVCGIAPTAVIAVFNEPLALYTLEKVGEEAAEEIAANVSTLIQLQSRKTIQSAIYNTFKSNRNLFRGTAIGFGRLLQSMGILDEESVNKANAKRNEPWSIHSALEDSIERIADPAKQAETEEFWDEFGEACIEAGYIVASSLDSWFMSRKVEEQARETSTEHTIIMSPSGAINTTITTVDTTATSS